MPEYREFLQGLIQNRHPLLSGIVAFNRRIASRLRPDVLSPEGAILSPLLRDEHASARLAQHLALLVPQAEAMDAGNYDFRLARHRLALLPEETLLQLARWYGLMRHRTEVMTLIDRPAVLALRAEVGEAGHHFVLRRSSLLPGARDEAEVKVPDAALPLSERVRHSGFAAIAHCLSDAPPSLMRVISWILPQDFAAHMTNAGNHDAPVADAAAPWPLLRTLLFKEIDPAWAPFFA